MKILCIESSHYDCTITHHPDKLQSGKFRSEKEYVFLTGVFDERARALEERTKKLNQFWNIDADIESVNWLDNIHVIVATECSTPNLSDG